MAVKYILWSTLLVVMGSNDAGVHQVTSVPFEDKAACDNAMEILIAGRPEKKITRDKGYVRTEVEIEGATLVNRLQCLPTSTEG